MAFATVASVLLRGLCRPLCEWPRCQHGLSGGSHIGGMLWLHAEVGYALVAYWSGDGTGKSHESWRAGRGAIVATTTAIGSGSIPGGSLGVESFMRRAKCKCFIWMTCR